MRQQAGIELFEGEVELDSAGMLVHGSGIPSDANVSARERDILLLSFPQKEGYAGLYLCFPIEQRQRFNGRDRAVSFIQACDLESLPDPGRWLEAEPAGPCSTFACSDTWVESPVAEGIALIGDAAGYNNFLIGQGLSLAFRDVVVLSKILLEAEDWSAASLLGYGEERRPRLMKSRYLAHLTGWKHRWFRDASRGRAVAARLAAEDDLIPQFQGDIHAGYEDDPAPSVEALWERLDQLEGRIEAEVATG